MSDKKPQISINVLYLYCNDINAIRHFYKDILGLGEHDFGMPKEFYCGKTSDGITMMWARSKDGNLPKRESWVDLPGVECGKLEEVSWGIQIPSDLFPEIVSKFKTEDTESRFPNPIWAQDSYWAFPVRDPMGYTVEVFSVPKKKPENKVWQG